MARGFDGGLVGRRELDGAVRSGVADAFAGHPPAHDVRIDRLRVRVPAGAGADEVGRAIARALERSVRERGRP
jgi:hypothetical protein